MDEVTIHDWLINQHIHVPSEWIQECISFLNSEGIPSNKLADSVYEQWLVGDLAMLEEPALSHFIKDGAKFTGSLALQVNYAIDISKSMYSQLRGLLGRNVGNLEVQDIEDPSTKWAPKASRCLMLEITDGVRKMKAIEQEPLPEVSSALQPGTKVLLRGPLRVVGSCLLLSKGCLTVLGGHVEELVVKYRPDKVLQELITHTNSVHTQNLSKRFQNPGKIKGGKLHTKSQLTSSAFRSNQHSEQKQTNNVRNAVAPSPDWDEPMSDSEFAAEVQNDGRTAADCSFDSDWSNIDSPSTHQLRRPTHNSTEVSRQVDDVDVLNWSDDDFTEVSKPEVKSKRAVAEDPTMLWSDTDDVVVPDEDLMCNKGHSFNYSHHSSHTDLAAQAVLTSSHSTSNNKTLCDPRNATSSRSSRDNYKAPSTSVSNMSASRRQPSEGRNSNDPPTTGMKKRVEHFVDLISSSDDDCDLSSPKRHCDNQQSHNAVLAPATSSSCSNQRLALATAKGSLTSPLGANNSLNAGSGKKPPGECSQFHRTQFHYLSQLTSSAPLNMVTVKAHVSTILDKIGTSADKSEWTLSARINDGTAYLDCRISHQVIEAHIGQVKETLRKSKANITDKRIVIQKMKNFADWLAAANGMIDVDLTNAARPVVLNIRPPTSEDLQLFKSCLAKK